MSTRPLVVSPLVPLILAAACWGLGTVASKRAVEEIPPFSLLAIQLAASLAALLVVSFVRRSPVRDPAMPPVLGRLGLLNPGLAYALSLLGLVGISASLSVLLWTVEPILIVILAAIALREPMTRRFVGLTAVALAGMALVLYEPGLGGSWPAIALTLAGVACCAVYTVVSRARLGEVELTAPVVVAQEAHALVLAVPLAIAAAVLGWGPAPQGPSSVALVSAVGSGVVYYGAAYLAYLSALRRLPASVAAASFYLIPLFGVAGGVLLLGERLSVGQATGAGLVLIAVVGILRPAAIPAGGRPVTIG